MYFSAFPSSNGSMYPQYICTAFNILTYQASYKGKVLLVYLCNEQIFCQAVSKVHTKFILEVLRDQPVKFNHYCSLSN